MNDPASQDAVTPAPDDRELLRRYAEEGSEPAFTELVRRHVDLVYGAALRRTGGDVHRAADVSQQVFTTLAREARKLSRHTVLGAWLHTATRNAALNLVISESRRHARELAAFDPAIVSEVAGPDWERLRPGDRCRDRRIAGGRSRGVVLRFLERRPLPRSGRRYTFQKTPRAMRTEIARSRNFVRP